MSEYVAAINPLFCTPAGWRRFRADSIGTTNTGHPVHRFFSSYYFPGCCTRGGQWRVGSNLKGRVDGSSSSNNNNNDDDNNNYYYYYTERTIVTTVARVQTQRRVVRARDERFPRARARSGRKVCCFLTGIGRPSASTRSDGFQ